MYRLVGISTNPISKKICLNSCRTLFTNIRYERRRVHNEKKKANVQGCKAPDSVGAPRALKLYGLNVRVFHEPLSTTVNICRSSSVDDDILQ